MNKIEALRIATEKRVKNKKEQLRKALSKMVKAKSDLVDFTPSQAIR